MLTNREKKVVEKIRDRWTPQAVTQPMNLDAWAKGDIDALIELVDKLQQDALAYERALEESLDDFDY